MSFAVLSPCLFYNDGYTDFEFVDRLIWLLTQIKSNTGLKIQRYSDGWGNRSQIFPELILLNPGYFHIKNAVAQFQKVLFSLIDKDNFADLSGLPKATIIEDYYLRNTPEVDLFKTYLYYLRDKEFLLFLGEQNSSITPKYLDDSGNDNIQYSTMFWKENSLDLIQYLNPNTAGGPFPYIAFFVNYNKLLCNESNGLPQPEKISLFEKAGHIVAMYNGYLYDSTLTEINKRRSGSLRKVYRKSDGMFYISIDFESGGLELFDSSLVHKGQYNFSCILSREADPIHHKLYTSNV